MNVWCMFCIRKISKTKNAKRVVLLYYLKYVFLISKSFYRICCCYRRYHHSNDIYYNLNSKSIAILLTYTHKHNKSTVKGTGKYVYLCAYLLTNTTNSLTQVVTYSRRTFFYFFYYILFPIRAFYVYFFSALTIILLIFLFYIYYVPLVT